MLRVGLTGGIGSGKSEVARRLASQGAVVLDAAAVAREVVALGTPGLAEVTAAFGTTVLLPDGSLNRAALAQVVFADPAQRERLNAIVHPRVRQRLDELQRAADPGAIVVQDLPLLAESPQRAGSFDLSVVIHAPPQGQVRRLVHDRGMTPEQAAARMNAQASREQRLAIADIVIDNSGSLAELDHHVQALWAQLRRRAAARAG